MNMQGIRSYSIRWGAGMLIAITVMSCKTSNVVKGAAVGTVVGGTAGALLTKKNKAVGIIAGAAVGGLIGAAIGDIMDRQARDIADDLGRSATVTRVGEGIVVSFDSGLMFDVDSDALRSATRSNLNQLAESLTKYPDTEVNILGHTDATGTHAYNQRLSERRAASVRGHLVGQGVDGIRLKIRGYGEADPVASNDTVDGRQQNRRVEIVIVATEELKKKVKEGSS
jgi:outer membrane protein OmpA-like peptidoglycan-associated protein